MTLQRCACSLFLTNLCCEQFQHVSIWVSVVECSDSKRGDQRRCDVVSRGSNAELDSSQG